LSFFLNHRKKGAGQLPYGVVAGNGLASMLKSGSLFVARYWKLLRSDMPLEFSTDLFKNTPDEASITRLASVLKLSKEDAKTILFDEPKV
jgi:hypothetical protein